MTSSGSDSATGPPADRQAARLAAARFRVQGLVQSVGFRPFVYRAARGLHLRGWVCNDPAGVLIHVEGPAEALDQFSHLLHTQPPPAAVVSSIVRTAAPAEGLTDFQVVPSRPGPLQGNALRVPRDRVLCAACRREIFDPANRRHGYPFTTCTDCGPRFSLLHTLPYDRPTTGMAGFPLCPACHAEYTDPLDRRFHAETIACPACGPRLALRDAAGRPLAADEPALAAAAEHLRQGRIIGLKGAGGFQLLVRADSSPAVTRLRDRKRRPTKPLAVMVHSLDEARRLALVGPCEERLLTSPENPIVLLPRRPDDPTLAPEIAPHLDRVGLLLPTTPLHELLLARVPFPVVATSGNLSEEPIVIDETRAPADLGAVADAFLVHDRPVLHRVDDSVMLAVGEQPLPIRLARGYVPLPLPALERWAAARGCAGRVLLATGGQQKVAPALWTGSQAVLGPHVGDLDAPSTRAAFDTLAHDLAALYACTPTHVACDLHPDYASTTWAQASGLPVTQIQHHHAHAVACMAEHDLLDREILTFTWDGTGYGPDGTIWGGEVLRARADRFQRVASLLPFPLPGGEQAIRQPNRVALVLLARTLGASTLLDAPRLLGRLGLDRPTAHLLLQMADRGVNSPLTTSMGRLFDAVAALVLGVREVTHEGEAATWLEAAADPAEPSAYPLPRADLPDPADIPRADWRPLVRALLADLDARVPPGACAARFHRALAEWALHVACGHPDLDIVLTGGCFLNAMLTRATQDCLRQAGRTVYRHVLVPPGDGGLAVGQLAAALALSPAAPAP